MRPGVPTPAEINAVLAQLPAEERLILPALQAVQRSVGYVPEEAVSPVAEQLNVSRAEVVGVLTYYHDLRTSPPPALDIRLCGAEACQAVGARYLRSWVEARYSEDVDVEVATVYCLGNCALGPAGQINGQLIGQLDVERLAQEVEAAREGKTNS